jgi:hypothetical protein
VLASDVLFDPAEWDALVRTFVAAGAPLVLLAHRVRNAQERQFFERWLPCAFSCVTVAVSAGSGEGGNVGEEMVDVELFELRPRCGGGGSGVMAAMAAAGGRGHGGDGSCCDHSGGCK